MTEPLDITGKIGPLYDTASGAEWPMYSYDTPAYTVWNAVANELHRKGWSEEEIKEWLQSKLSRWAMDGALGEALIEAATQYAATITK